MGVQAPNASPSSRALTSDNLNEMLQLLVAPSKTSAVFYRGFYVLLPELMYALIGTFGAKLSSDSASAAVVSSSLGSTSAVSQSASSAEVSSSSDFISVGASSSRACQLRMYVCAYWFLNNSV